MASTITGLQPPITLVSPTMSRQDSLTEALIKVVEAAEDKFEKQAKEVSGYKSPRAYGKMAGAALGGAVGGAAGLGLGQTVGEELGGMIGGEAPATQQVNMIRLQQASQEMTLVASTVSNTLKADADAKRAISANIRG